MPKLLYLLLLSGIMLAGCRHPAVDDADLPGREWFESASLDELDHFIDMNTNSLFAYHERGRRYAELGRYPEALLDSITCIERWPEQANGYWLRGWLLNEKQAFEDAVVDYSRAVHLAPDERRLYIQRADIYIRLNEIGLALSDLNKAIERDQSSYYPYLMRGIIYYGAILNPEQAESDFTKSIELQPESSYSHLMRGSLYYWLQKDELALADFNRAIELEPDRTGGYLSRAGLYYRQRDIGKALADYLKVLALDPTIYGVQKRIGDLCVLQGSTDAAIDAYKEMLFWFAQQNDPFAGIKPQAASIEIPQAKRAEVLKVYPECDEFYLAWAKISYDNKNYKDALSLVNRGIELNPENMDMILYRGAIRAVLEDQDGALEDINRAIEMNPVYAMGYIGRATFLQMYGESEQAVEDYTKAINLCDEVAFSFYLRAGAYSDLGQYDSALVDYDRAVELSDGNVVYRRARAFFYEKAGDQASALEYYDAEIAEQPNGYFPYVARGTFYQRQKRFEEAVSDYTVAIERAIQAGVPSHNLRSHYLDRSDVFQFLGKYDEAIRDATSAIDCTEENNYYAFVRRGRVYEKNKQYELALCDFERALAINPDEGYTHYERAQTLRYLKRYEDALEEYDLIIENDMMAGEHSWLAVWWHAEVLAQLGQYQEAIEEMDALLIMYPTNQGLIDRRKVIAEYGGITDSPVSGLLELKK